MDQVKIDRLNELTGKENSESGLNPQEREELRLLKMEQMSELVMGLDDDDDE